MSASRRLHDPAVVPEGEPAIDLGHVALEVVEVALDEAAGDHQSAQPSELLVAGHLDDRLDATPPWPGR